MAGNYLRLQMLSKEARKAQRTVVRETATLETMPEEEFLENFKVSRDFINYIVDELEGDLAPKHPTGYAVVFKVISSLKILMTGHYQRSTGQEQHVSVAQTTVSKYFDQFVDAVNRNLMPRWIVFPGTQGSREQVAAKFQENFGLPDILGCVDCTHVDIFPPHMIHQAQYINRYGDTSINVQLVGDADCRILNVNANYPGRVHDQFIFNNSAIRTELRRLYDQRIGNYYLLGDSGYALEPWMMTPIRNAAPGPELSYTRWHCATRNLIERTNGYLKGTFRCLGIDRTLHYSPEKAAKIIYACCTLYNIMRHFRVPMVLANDPPVERQPVQLPANQRLTAAQNKRAHIIQEYFN